MGNVRNRLFGFVSAVAGVVTALSFLLFPSASAASSPLVVGVAGGVTWLVLMGGIYLLTLSPGEKTQDLVEAIRGYSIGQHTVRLDAERFGALEDVAIACNELGAALTEGQDPNLGTIKRRPRVAQRGEPLKVDPRAEDAAFAERDDPHVGEVRRIPKANAPKADTSKDAASVVPSKSVAPGSLAPAVEDENNHASASGAPDDNDTVIDSASGRSVIPTDAPAAASENVDSSAPAEDGDPIERLFADYTAALELVGSAVDLDYDEFRTTIAAEQNALIEQHGCKAIRFEVRVNDDDVSLLPHLVR